MKTLLLLALTIASCTAQLPPYQRNTFTTNNDANAKSAVFGLYSFQTDTLHINDPVSGDENVLSYSSHTTILGNDISATKVRMQVSSVATTLDFTGDSLDATGPLDIGKNTPLGGLRVGANAATLTNTLTASASLDFPNTPGQTDADLPITLVGAAAGDVVALGAPIPSTGGAYTAYASNGAVYVRFSNYSAGAINPAAATFKVQVNKFR